ncbi:MAG TPA: hypothetical protein VLJ57_10710 [Burkholderiaceae bacterium]|nr:hypothetical protein [Burkholderiaceae bacterium]
MNNSEPAASLNHEAQSDRRSQSTHGRPRRHFAQSVVLHCPQGCGIQLGQILASFILDGVRHVHLAGPDGGHVKGLIEAILQRGGFDVPIATTWYEGETLESVIAFARDYCRQPPGGTQVVQL